MERLESDNLLQPHSAVAYLAPSYHENSEAQLQEPLFTPEHNGQRYNVHDPRDAEAYLTEVHGRNLPKIRGEFDASTGFHLALALQNEKRAAIYESGEHENVAEHSFFLTTTTVWVALAERPDLNAGTVAIMSNFHDLVVEAYGGDTPLHDQEALATKEYREAAGLTLFLQDVGLDSPLAKIMLDYEYGRTPEGRFVKGMDKVLAYQLSLATKAALHYMNEENFPDVVTRALPKAAIDPTAFEKMKGVLKEVGRNWIKWKCLRFDGDPNSIVDDIARQVIDRGAEVVPLREEPVPTRLQASAKVATLIHFPDIVELHERRPAEPEAEGIHKIGNLAILAEWRHNNDLPPTPPASPMALTVAN